MKKLSYSTTLHPEDVYGQNFENNPRFIKTLEKYKVIDFRPPLNGEMFIYEDSLRYKTFPCVSAARGDFKIPKLIVILRAVSNLVHPVSIEDIYETPSVNIPDGWRFVRFGKVLDGEYYVSMLDHTEIRLGSNHSTMPKIIVEKEE